MNHSPSVCFITLGCAKNEVDTNRMRAHISASALREVDDPAAADVVIVNTCSFITEATEESLAAIFEVLTLPNFEQGRAKLVVAGCMPARYGAELRSELPEVAAFVSAADEDGIVEVCRRLLGESLVCEQTGFALPHRAEPSRIVDASWAYVKISDGCSRRCSYCTIPLIRGPYRSRLYAEIVAEVDELVAGGAREIILIGQDTGIWGCDLKGCDLKHEAKPDSLQKDSLQRPQTLAQLLDVFADRYPHTWFRVMYLQPQGITDELLAAIQRHDNICNYFDIPLQHVNARVLKEMNRSGSPEAHQSLIARIRAALPDATLRTTLIAGFPGETREEAAELKAFVETADFDYVGVFAYSQEDETPAGKRVDQLPLRVRISRQQRLRDAADAIGFERAAKKVGIEQDVLICGVDEDGLFGRTQGQAPEVDGLVYVQGIDADAAFERGIIRVRITDVACYDLFGEVINERAGEVVDGNASGVTDGNASKSNR